MFPAALVPSEMTQQNSHGINRLYNFTCNHSSPPSCSTRIELSSPDKILGFEMSFEILVYWLRAVFSGETGISFYTLPLSWIICLLPRLFAILTYATCTGKAVEFGHPRSLVQVAGSDPALASRTRGRIVRAEAAAADTIESAPYFAAAILAGNQLDLPVGLLNALSLAYLATRVAYIHAYIFSETIAVAILRATLFSIGHVIIWSLFILAGMQA